ncbi:MAG: rhodanese-like domain-containing protein [Thermoanaerobaculia bacterium]
MRSRILAGAAVLLLVACTAEQPQEASATWETQEPGASLPQTTAAPEPAVEPPGTADARRMSVQAVQAGVDSGAIVLVDVRSAQAYAVEHARGAINIPLQDVPARARELPMGKQIVAYCT